MTQPDEQPPEEPGEQRTVRFPTAFTVAPMELLDSTGRPVRFNPGPIWVQLVHPDTKVSF